MKPLKFFGVVKRSIRLWQKHKAVISKCEASRKKFTGPKKGQFPNIYDAGFTFIQERLKTGINCIVLFLQHEWWLHHFSKVQLSTANINHMQF
jgi:hypothetical protein